jgi:hypothetical protein
MNFRLGGMIFMIVFVARFSAAEDAAVWSGAEYPQRYVLRVAPPPAAGGIGLLPQTVGDGETLAFVRLPLRFASAADGVWQPEALLLTDEKGKKLPLLARADADDVEIVTAFPSAPTRRKFYLYFGALEGGARESSPANYQGRALAVRVIGRSVSEDLAWRKTNPLTVSRFQAIFPPENQVGLFAKAYCVDDSVIPFPDPLLPKVPALQPMPRETNIVWMSNYAAAYEGLLRTPVGGEYQFALDTPGAAFVLLDGVPVCGSDSPDPERPPLSLAGKIQLTAGIHRVAVFHALGNGVPGLRLLWRPPGAAGLLRIPAQSFPRGLPALAEGLESRSVEGLTSQSFIHAEILGRARSEAHLGPEREREWVLVYLKAVGPQVADGGRLHVAADDGSSPVSVENNEWFGWLPAGKPLSVAWLANDQALAKRDLSFIPKAAQERRLGILDQDEERRRNADELLDLAARLDLRSAPRFLRPDEAAHFYLETALAPFPVLERKHDIERRLWWPPARPLGEFELRWTLKGAEALILSGTHGATPPARWAGTKVEDERSPTTETHEPHRLRLEISGADLARALRAPTARLELELNVGGVPAGRTSVRLLHSQQPWPDGICAGRDGLFLRAADNREAAENLLVLVPREQEAEYRRHALTRGLTRSGDRARAFFLGDPLCEKQPSAKTFPGLAGDLAAQTQGVQWSACCLPGPHSGRPIYQFIAALEDWVRKEKVERLPAQVVVSLGSGDALWRTPAHDFDRGFDVLTHRLRMRGVRDIFIVGVVPLPGEMAAAKRMQAVVGEALRRHHLSGLDVAALWFEENNWERRFAAPGTTAETVLGPTPNSMTRKELARLTIERFFR